MACTFRSLWVFKISSGRVILTRKFPTVEHRHRSAVTVHRPSPKNSDGEVAQHATESDSKVGSKHDNDLSAALTKIPSRREIERRLRTALGTSQAREHPALPVLDLGGSLWPIVAVVRGDHVLLGLVLVPAGAMATHFDRSRKDEGRQSGAKLMLRLPVVTAAVSVLDMLAEALEQSLQDAATGGEGASTTAELAKVLADITMFMPFGSPVEADISVARQYRCNHASAKATDKAAKSSRLKQPPWQPVLAKAAPLPGDAGSRSSRRRTSGSVEFWVHETISFAQGCNKDILDLDAVEVTGRIMTRAAIGPARNVVVAVSLPHRNDNVDAGRCASCSVHLMQTHDCVEALTPDIWSTTLRRQQGKKKEESPSSPLVDVEDFFDSGKKQQQPCAQFLMRQPPTGAFEMCQYQVTWPDVDATKSKSGTVTAHARNRQVPFRGSFRMERLGLTSARIRAEVVMQVGMSQSNASRMWDKVHCCMFHLCLGLTSPGTIQESALTVSAGTVKIGVSNVVNDGETCSDNRPHNRATDVIWDLSAAGFGSANGAAVFVRSDNGIVYQRALMSGTITFSNEISETRRHRPAASTNEAVPRAATLHLAPSLLDLYTPIRGVRSTPNGSVLPPLKSTAFGLLEFEVSHSVTADRDNGRSSRGASSPLRESQVGQHICATTASGLQVDHTGVQVRQMADNTSQESSDSKAPSSLSSVLSAVSQAVTSTFGNKSATTPRALGAPSAEVAVHHIVKSDVCVVWNNTNNTTP